MKGLRLPLATRVTILYALIGGLWILLSDRMVAAVFRDPAELTVVQTYKGWLFVLATGLVLFTYLARENKIRNTSEQEFSNIFEHAVEGIFQSTLEGRFIRVNSAMARLYGYDSPSEMISTVTDISKQIQVNVKTREQFTTSLLQNGFVERFEAQSCRKDSSLIWTSTNARLVRDENGTPLYFEGFVTDITSNKLAETALKDAEIRYRDLVEQLPAAVYTDMPENNLDDGIYISPQIEAISGYPPEAWMNRQGFRAEVLHPDDLERFVKENDRTNVTGEPFDIEYRIIAGDGRIVWIHDMARLVRNAEGKPLYWQGLMLDITENKTAEQQIKASEDQYRRLVEHSPYAVAVHSKGSLVYVNQAGVKLIGAKNAEELLGTPIMDFVHPDSRPDVTKRFQEMQEGKEVPPIEEKFVRRDGSTIPVEAAAYPFTYQNKPAIQVFIRDLTEQKQAEAAIRASEERFSKTFHASPIPICITTLEKGVFLDVNEAYIKLTKWSREELIGHTTEELKIYLPGEREEFVDKLVNKRIVQGEVDKFITATDEVLEAAAFYELIELGGQTCILSMFYDMTEQRQAREIILANEEKLRAIVEHTQNIYYSHTPDHMLTYMSGQTKVILGYEPEEALIRWQDFITDHPMNQRGIELTQRAIDTGIAQEPYILELKAKDGKHVWVEVRETPVVRDGNTVAIVGALTDITDRKKAEEDLERRLAELTVLHAVAMAGSQSDSEDDVIERTTQIVSGMLYPDNCGVLLLNEAGKALDAHPSYWGANLESGSQEFPLSVGISGQVATSGRPARVNDVLQNAAYIEVTTGIRSELCVPIRVNERIIGALNVESRKLNAFDEEDERVLNTIAGTLGTAIERIRLLKSEQKQRREAENLREATAALTKTIELEKLYEVILDSLSKLAAHVSASIEMVDGEHVEIVAARGLPENNHFIGKTSPLRAGQWESDIRSPIIIADAQSDERFEKIQGTEYIRGWMSIPMIAQDKLIGYLNADSDIVGFYTEEQAALIQIFANQAATAIENARRFQSEKRRRTEAENLQVAATAITSSLNVEEVLQTILVALKHVTPYDSASMLLLEGDQVRIRAAKGLPKPDLALNQLFPASNALLRAIQKSGRPVIVQDAQNDPRFEKWAAADNVHGWLGVPLIARGQIIGYITLDSYTECAFDEHDAALAQTFAHQAAAVIDNANLFQSLQATNDELSKAYDTTLEGWGKALELRDKETQGHTKRVKDLTVRLARQIGIGEPELTHIRRGVLVHDIGKMGVRDSILHKKGQLTKKEWEEMRRHPHHAFDLLYPIPYLRPSLDIAYCHHERWDGTGYPRGLKGEEIPLAARLFAVVDVWDALLSDRPYRKAWTKKKVEKYIHDQAGTHFDPQIVKAFLKMIERNGRK